MLSLQFVRENPDAVHKALRDRGIEETGLDEILRLDVVKDGKYVCTTRPGGRTATIRYRDNAPHPGRTYYYVRVFQRDPGAPDGDPEIAWGSPFYVTYQ